MNKLLKKIQNTISFFHLDKNSHAFIKHNQKLFSKSENDNGIILLEFNDLNPSHISYSYVSNVLSKHHKSKIVGYLPKEQNYFQILRFYIAKLFNLGIFKIYRSFRVEDFFFAISTKSIRNQAKSIIENLSLEVSSKKAFEELVIYDVKIGDLIYDSYLREKSLPTIDLESNEFRIFLYESICLYLFWVKFFKENNITAVIVSHPVYNLAMPLRLAVKLGIPAYLSSLQDLYYFSNNKITAYDEFKDYRNAFLQLSKEDQIKGLEIARKRIQMRFDGKVGVDMLDSQKSAFHHNYIKNVISASDNTKILIAAHCFFDSPHSYGNNLYPDFYEWIDALGKISNETDYEWYIKTHSDYLEGTLEIIKSFLEKYPKFKLLPPDISHYQIIESGIDCVLTVYGTIAFEYALLGVKVINCSISNPHIAYNFNFHPQTLDEYENMIRNIDNLALEINPNEIYEYYFMRRVYSSSNIFVKDFEKFIDRLGGYYQQFNSNVYSNWIEEFDITNHNKINKEISKFILSKKERFNVPNSMEI